MNEQFDLPFDSIFAVGESPALWTPRDIWVRLNQRLIEHFKEDRRIERKGCKKIHLDELATYYSTFSNTPDGGLIVYGIEDDGEIVGCSQLSVDQLNSLETCQLTRCPQARPEFKRIPVVINEKEDFCFSIFVPYVGRLVETNKGDAWIRYGDSRHKMSEEEKRDFRATRQELSFEMEVAPYQWPKDFDLRIIQDFCDAFRERESKKDWTNNEVLLDRHLLRRGEKGKLEPLNSLVLMASRDPRLTIPGCRVRVQRFTSEQEGTGGSNKEYSPVRDKFIEGNLVTIISKASEAISDQIYDVTWLNTDGKFITTPSILSGHGLKL